MQVKKKRFGVAFYGITICFLALNCMGGKISSAFHQVGISMIDPNAQGTGWSTLGESFRQGEIPHSIFWRKRFDRDSLFGWDSEIDSSWKLSNWLGSYEPTFAPWISILPSFGFTSIRQILTPCGCGRTNWMAMDKPRLFPYLRQNLPASWLSLKPESPALPYSTISRTKLGLSWELRSLRW